MKGLFVPLVPPDELTKSSLRVFVGSGACLISSPGIGSLAVKLIWRTAASLLDRFVRYLRRLNEVLFDYLWKIMLRRERMLEFAFVLPCRLTIDEESQPRLYERLLLTFRLAPDRDPAPPPV